ncbi:hypothetical protein [Alkalicoccus urumqiensis]|uniref:hypothetical protein n=1 Tax=Alkalicoccus urumqiensis TaxID=1548213 RepID=UPI0015E60551|nr:hypothetical protein [Alkalicoccus urumqiensis]
MDVINAIQTVLTLVILAAGVGLLVGMWRIIRKQGKGVLLASVGAMAAAFVAFMFTVEPTPPEELAAQEAAEQAEREAQEAEEQAQAEEEAAEEAEAEAQAEQDRQEAETEREAAEAEAEAEENTQAEREAAAEEVEENAAQEESAEAPADEGPETVEEILDYFAGPDATTEVDVSPHGSNPSGDDLNVHATVFPAEEPDKREMLAKFRTIATQIFAQHADVLEVFVQFEMPETGTQAVRVSVMRDDAADMTVDNLEDIASFYVIHPTFE